MSSRRNDTWLELKADGFVLIFVFRVSYGASSYNGCNETNVYRDFGEDEKINETFLEIDVGIIDGADARGRTTVSTKKKYM